MAKIFGGAEAEHVDFPHQVYLSKLNRNNRREQFCGASIIHPYLLICAAHCFDIKPRNVTVTAGGYVTGSPQEKEQVRDVAHFFGHPMYDATTWDNDIAVLVLSQPLDFDEPNVKPIKLREPNWKLPGAECFDVQLFQLLYRSENNFMKIDCHSSCQCERLWSYRPETPISDTASGRSPTCGQ